MDRRELFGNSRGRMMRLWKASYAQPSRVRGAAALSVGTHVVVIVAWIGSTLPPAGLSLESVANRVYYILPPNPPPPPSASQEQVHYMSLTAGDGVGPGPATTDASKPYSSGITSSVAGETAPDTARAPAPAAKPSGETRSDSVYTVLDVDSAVVRAQISAAPAYPVDLLQKHVEGSVVVQYVVDTTGFADTSSFVVLRSTDYGFVRAVHDALPYMRFTPAKIGRQKVRQLVQQPFTFRIAPDLTAPTKVGGGKRP
jgi:TonB family protein